MFWRPKHILILCVLLTTSAILVFEYTYKTGEGKLQSVNETSPEHSFVKYDKASMDLLYQKITFDESTREKTTVMRFNGEKFERLYEFCTWTQQFHCSMLKTPAGKMPIFHHDPKIDPVMGAQLAKNGGRDRKEIAIILKELEKYPEAMFLDLGANVGIYSLTIAKTLRRKVIAVEPVIENAVKLCKSIQENGLTENVTLVFNPLSDMHTLVDMMKPPRHLSASEVKPLDSAWLQKGAESRCPRDPPYQTVCLDDLLSLVASRTAVIKIDVESFEYHTMRGGQRFLDNVDVPAISMEWEHVKKKANSSQFVDMMKRRSYVAYSTDHKVLSYKNFMDWPWDIVWRKQ